MTNIPHLICNLLIETLEVRSNDTTELTEFDSILKAIQGKLPFIQ